MEDGEFRATSLRWLLNTPTAATNAARIITEVAARRFGRSVLSFVVAFLVCSSCGVDPKRDLERFERDFKKRADFSQFTNAAISLLKPGNDEDVAKALERLDRVTPQLGKIPRTIGLNDAQKGKLRLIRVTYFEGLVQYEVLVIAPGTLPPSEELKQGGFLKQISDAVYVRRLNL